MTTFKHDTITPYANDEAKKSQVKDMFDGIAPRYDFLNHFLSFGTDILWRKLALGKISKSKHDTILDIATGTGDLAIAAAKKFKPSKIVGLDIAANMLKIGEQKSIKEGLQDIISFETGDSEALRFDSESFDTVMASFGVRNFENLEGGLSEMRRVMKTGGTLMILEFSTPRIFPIKQLYFFYFRYILPLIGKIISKDSRAYTYLYESSANFPSFEAFNSVLNKIGFKELRYYPLTFGICCVYTAKK
jgi:demethylmenaquinone methyltransferase / 2-methoxy-6-polyprenyl-1,4-benzoquinol methylase